MKEKKTARASNERDVRAIMRVSSQAASIIRMERASTDLTEKTMR